MTSHHNNIDSHPSRLPTKKSQYIILCTTNSIQKIPTAGITFLVTAQAILQKVDINTQGIHNTHSLLIETNQAIIIPHVYR